MSGDTQPAHSVTLAPTRGPAGGRQWLTSCRCGWVDVEVVQHLAQSAGREHVSTQHDDAPST